MLLSHVSSKGKVREVVCTANRMISIALLFRRHAMVAAAAAAAANVEAGDNGRCGTDTSELLLQPSFAANVSNTACASCIGFVAHVVKAP